MIHLLLILTACVPKKKYEAQLDQVEVLSKQLAEARAATKALEDSLEAEAQANASLTSLAEALEQRSKALSEQLTELSGRLRKLGQESSAQQEANAELESRLAELQTNADAARADAEAARERASQLAAERERLEAEAARLAAEKAELQKKTAEYDALVGELESEIAAGQITITELSGKLTVEMSNAILFDSGSTKIKKAGQEALAKVAGVLAKVTDREIRVEGHTDDVPVGSGAPYPDNWALSSLRASGVVALLVEGGVDPLNIAAVGFSEHRPKASNDTTEGKAANRRTEIVLVPRLQ